MANRRPRPILWLLLLLIVLALVGQAVPLYTDWLWFQEVGYAGVFVTILSLRGWLFIGVGLGTFVFLYGNLAFAARTARPDVYWELEDQLGLPGRVVLEPLIQRLLRPVLAVIAFFSGVSASANWETVLEYFNGRFVPFGITAPDVGWGLGQDLSFYMFILPFWRLLYGWAMVLIAATIGLSLALYVLQRSLVLTARGPRLAAGARVHLLGLGAVLLLIKAWGFWLDRFEIMYSARGVVFGASYTDVNASLPVLGILTALTLLCAATCLFQIWRPGWRFLLAGLVVLAGVWVVGLGVAPTMLQSYRVKPNELVYERPYIQHNIRMTRQAYGLDRVAEKDFPAEENLTAAALDRNSLTIKNIRLWDHRPLLRTYGKLQEIRTYYKFVDVDVDRYMVGGEYRQVMLSARELSSSNLPSRGWINEALTYTHGYGLVAGPVNRISPQGLPEFFIKDIPPAGSGLPKITRPEIYYGERGNDFVFVRTKSQELDYPSGDQNVYTRYTGTGGIPVNSALRKLAFAMHFREINVLLSNDLNAESRIMIYRNIAARVHQAAPFLKFDRDPYLVVADDGRLVWLIDGYTMSNRYPYSRPERGINYIRNSVKATVDAYHGTVTFYLADPSDPIIRTYARAFPGIFKPLGDMPADLQRHIRYPEGLFAVQARMYATYHMEDPQVFYNKEDLWIIPQLPQEGREREMEPYFTVMRLPGEAKEEFVLLSGFNPSGRDNMIALMVARMDAPNYGRIIAYAFPKQKLVFGPRNIHARINQDPVISQQISLWNQQGSRVTPGALIAIPIDQSLIYVQPLYLEASEGGAIPELRRVVVAYGNQIAMEPTLEQSLQRIFGGRTRVEDAARPAAGVGPPAAGEAGLRGLAQRAWEAWSRAQEALRRGDWSAYGEEQRRLEQALRELRERSGR